MIPKDTLITISVGLSLVLVAGGIWLVWRKISRQGLSGNPAENHPELEREESVKPDVEDSTVESPPIVEPVKPPEAPTRDKPKSAGERLASHALKVPDSDLNEFLKEITERVKETGPCFDGETPFNFIEEMVDRLDDLWAILENPSTQSPNDIESFRTILIEVLSECGAQLIHSDVWDASCQRAITKEVTPGIAAPIILRFGSTGIRRLGQLVRKQEVVLAVPESN